MDLKPKYTLKVCDGIFEHPHIKLYLEQPYINWLGYVKIRKNVLVVIYETRYETIVSNKVIRLATDLLLKLEKENYLE